MQRRIFVSVNTDRTLDERQRRIKSLVLDRVEQAGFAPQIFFERGAARDLAWSFSSVNDVLSRCVGAIVLGFPRWRATTEDGTALLIGEYSHIEGSAAVARGLPTFIAAEDGVADRGIVYRGGGHVVSPISATDTVDQVLAAEFGLRLNEWLRALADRRDIFLGYCSQSSGAAAQIARLLEAQGATIHDWTLDFGVGGFVLEQIERARGMCTAGVFVFSEDDVLHGESGNRVPRDNVVFEAGYFMAAKGPERVLIVRVGNAKIPSDLGGNIYAQLSSADEVASLEGQLSRFVHGRL
jgi:hypothetical protein